jgi:hypothetical protein
MRQSRSLALVLVLAIVGCEKKNESAWKVMYYLRVSLSSS